MFSGSRAEVRVRSGCVLAPERSGLPCPGLWNVLPGALKCVLASEFPPEQGSRPGSCEEVSAGVETKGRAQLRPT